MKGIGLHVVFRKIEPDLKKGGIELMQDKSLIAEGVVTSAGPDSMVKEGDRILYSKGRGVLIGDDLYAIKGGHDGDIFGTL